MSRPMVIESLSPVDTSDLYDRIPLSCQLPTTSETCMCMWYQVDWGICGPWPPGWGCLLVNGTVASLWVSSYAEPPTRAARCCRCLVGAAIEGRTHCLEP